MRQYISGAYTLPENPHDSPFNFQWPAFNSAAIVQKGVDNALKPFKIEPMKKNLHFVTAILARIAHFHALKTPFSAHDLTRSLREKVAAGEYALRDVTETDTFDNQVLPVIDHSKVRDVVKELFELDLVPDYKPKNHTDVGSGASYVLYEHDKASTSEATDMPTYKFDKPISVPTPDTSTAAQNVAVATQTPIIAAVQKAPLKQPDSEMWEKADDYVANQYLLGHRPTMKQVQSRLKGYKVTCKELEDKLSAYSWALNRGLTPSTTRVA